VKVQYGCLCGEIQYEIIGPLTNLGNCHCSMCRRFQGVAVATYAKVGAEHVRWLSGQNLLTAYKSSPGIGWACGRICGSSLGVPTLGKLNDIALGPLDSDPGVRPSEHIFFDSKADWSQITATLPQHDERPPGKLP
jgi:hypothetical protein